MKKIYIIGIGGVGIGAIARHYLQMGYKVYGSDLVWNDLLDRLEEEGVDIKIGERPDFIDNSFEKIIYSIAIPKTQSEMQKAEKLSIPRKSYIDEIVELSKNRKLISIAGSHGKSTTTALASIMFKNTDLNFMSISGTLFKQFDNKNYFYRTDNKNEEYFILESCEYRRTFLNYNPYILTILNIDIDHWDYFKDEEDYFLAFKEYVDKVKVGGKVILNGQDKWCRKLVGLRGDIDYIIVYNNYFEYNGQKIDFPKIELKVPGNHILFDSKFVYIIGYLLNIDENNILESLRQYNGNWRRMEEIGQTKNDNILMSDYAHHPTEVDKTLEAIREKYPNKKILVVCQVKQFSRAINLLDGFKNAFKDADELIIPDIHEARDSEEDKKAINTEKFTSLINHSNKKVGGNMKNTLKLINKFDTKNKNALIVLMGSSDIDDLRYEIDLV